VPIQLHCGCGKRLQVKPELAGGQVRCPGCRQILLVPGPPPSAPGGISGGSPSPIAGEATPVSLTVDGEARIRAAAIAPYRYWQAIVLGTVCFGLALGGIFFVRGFVTGFLEDPGAGTAWRRATNYETRNAFIAGLVTGPLGGLLLLLAGRKIGHPLAFPAFRKARRDKDAAMLLAALQDHRHEVRRAAAEILTELAVDDRSLAPATLEGLFALLAESQGYGMVRVSGLLGMLAPVASAGVPVLSKSLASPEATVRSVACVLLGHCRDAAGQAVPQLTRALQDPDPAVREAAAKAIAMLAPGKLATREMGKT
jgi:hypothetical protein